MTDESQAIAQELMTVTGVADKAVALLRKMLDGLEVPLDDLLDVDAFRQHIQSVGTLAYAEVYTESEMQDALAFFTSSSGQAMAAKLPAIEQRIEASVQSFMATALKL
jgi:NCAIR mutase (PurE)-related protein